jgi:DNA replication protein DnaC
LLDSLSSYDTLTQETQDEPIQPTCSDLVLRAQKLGMLGFCIHLNQVGFEPWMPILLDLEEQARQKRSLDRRVLAAHLGSYRSMGDYDWSWAKKIDRTQIQESMGLGFVKEHENIILLGPNGVGKTMISKNIAYQALLSGMTVLFTTASSMLADLAQRDSSRALQQRVRVYARPQLLVIDEVGYLSYDNRHADLLFEVITRRYERASTVITTNKPFSEWNDVFPNAACVVTLIDRLTHHAEVIQIEADSYRLKEAKERAAEKTRRRKDKRPAQAGA